MERVDYLLDVCINNQPLSESHISLTTGLVVLSGLCPDNVPKPACLAFSNSFFFAVERKALHLSINNTFQKKPVLKPAKLL